MSWRFGIVASAVIAALLIDVPTAWAHGGGIPIDFYGGFTRGAVKCLRRITIAGRRCARQTYSLLRNCADQELRGGSCDRSARDAALDAALGAALGSIERHCSGGQLTEVGLITFGDARSDMRQFCLRGEHAARAVYDPVQEVPANETQVRCALMAGELTEKVFGRAMSLKSQAIDRIAVRFLTPKQKNKMISGATAHVRVTRAKSVVKLQELCPEIESVYGKSAEAFATAIEGSADCALSFLYVQTAVLCPP